MHRNALELYIVACRDLLPANHHETNNEMMPIARQQILNKEQLNRNN
jgi:hypothetical protein